MKTHGIWLAKPDVKSMVVPLWHSHEAGDLIDGYIDVPANLCGKQHTNAALKRHNLIRSHMERWIAWRKKQGWVLASKPKVTGPFDIPTENAGAEVDTEHKRYMVRARFKREHPLYMSLEDFVATQDMAKAYGVDLKGERLPENRLPTPVEEIIV